MKRHLVTLVVLGLMATSCGGSDDPSALTLTDASGTQAASDEATAPALVGTWERETRCEELVSALEQAGLDQWVLESVAGNAFIPGVTSPDQIADPAHPCEGAVPREHSHVFTEDGSFESLDWNGEPVDDGTFEIIDDHTFVVSKEFPDVTFGYAIQGDTIMFDPVIPDCTPQCFEAAWSVSVAYPGQEWHRVSDQP